MGYSCYKLASTFLRIFLHHITSGITTKHRLSNLHAEREAQKKMSLI